MKDFDVIVIGSGIGGLVGAGVLASRGLKVLVVEKHVSAGGYLASFKRRGFTFDASVDCISGVAPGGVIRRVIEMLGVEKEIGFLKVDPVRVSIFPGMEVPVDSDVDRYIERLSSLFPSEAEGIRRFFKFSARAYGDLNGAVDALVHGRGTHVPSPEFLKLLNTRYGGLLEEFIRDVRLRAVLSDRCPFIGLPPSGVSAASMVALMMSYFKLGAYRPEGGFQRLADVLADGIRRQGGTLLLGNGARKIMTDGKALCTGVECEDGERYGARYVVSNADFIHTFGDLLGGEHSEAATGALRHPGVSTSFFIVYAGMKGEAGCHSSVGYFPSYDMEGFFRRDAASREDSTIGITVASVEDPSRAPAGFHTVVLHEMARASKASIDKEKCAEVVLKKAERVIPGLSERAVVVDSASPLTLERYTGNQGGAAFGWRQVPGFGAACRHRIRNLFIAGHWGDMGGGVLAAAFSGARAAAEILRGEGIESGL